MRRGRAWTWHFAVLSIAIAAGASAAEVSAPSCPPAVSATDPALQRAYAEFRRSVDSSPFARYPGRRASCSARVEGGSIRLEYVFMNGARLDAKRDPAIEYTEQRLDVTGLAQKTALALLQRTERWAFGEKGCGISWKISPERENGSAPGRREVVYRGEACNCQGRLVFSGEVLTGLIFRSAC
jgi:hypothetical protein